MSDYHILEQTKDRKYLSVVFHIPVPDTGTNKANTQWRDAIVQEAGGTDNIFSIIPSLSGGAEETLMKSGALVEVRESIRILSGWSDVEKRNKIESRYTTLTSSFISEKQVILEWLGYSNDV